MPRAFVVHKAIEVGDAEEALAKIKSTELEFSEWAVIEAATQLDCELSGKNQEGEAVDFVEYSPQKVVLQTSTMSDGWLVLNDLYYPGWQAMIDGQVTSIYPTDYALRGICIPAGEHIVTMEFRPSILPTGVIISFVGWGIILGLAVYYFIRSIKGQR